MKNQRSHKPSMKIQTMQNRKARMTRERTHPGPPCILVHLFEKHEGPEYYCAQVCIRCYRFTLSTNCEKGSESNPETGVNGTVALSQGNGVDSLQ